MPKVTMNRDEAATQVGEIVKQTAADAMKAMGELERRRYIRLFEAGWDTAIAAVRARHPGIDI